MNTTVVEIVNFKLNAGVTAADLESTYDGINSFLQSQPGFLYRSLSHNEADKSWIDIVYWENMDTAKAASEALMQDEEGKKMVAMCDMDSVSISHLPALTEAMSKTCESAA